MGSIYKRGNIWYIDVLAGGKRIRERVGTSKKIARDEFGFAKSGAFINKFLERFLEYSDANHCLTSDKYRHMRVLN